LRAFFSFSRSVNGFVGGRPRIPRENKIIYRQKP
jgi:hypothetical protein